MIQVLSRKDINTELWDSCIDKSSNAQIFGYSWYLDCCCIEWKGIIENNYESVFPIATKKKFGVDYIYQPFFTRHFGVYSSAENSSEKRLQFLKSIPSKYRYWDFCLNSSHEEHIDNTIAEKKVYQELDLKTDYTVIRKRYHENLLRNLKKAEKENLVIINEFDPDSVIAGFRIHQKNKNLGFAENDFETLSAITKSVIKRNKARCVAVKNLKGEILAGAFFMETNERIVYLKGFSSEEGKKCGAMHYIFDKLIAEMSGRSLILDFGGSNVESVARFYRSFGARDCVYLHLQLNRLPYVLKWLKR